MTRRSFSRSLLGTGSFMVVMGLCLGLAMELGCSANGQRQERPSSKPAPTSMLAPTNGNPYLEERVKAAAQQLEKEHKAGHFKTQLLNTTPDELLLAIDRTAGGDSILAVDYGIDWEGSDFNKYLMANLQAAGRGVTITRVFIIPQKVPSNPLCRVMKRQAEAGIAVRIAEKETLKDKPEYQRETQARVLFQYKGGQAVLMVEAVPFPELKLGEPYLLDVTWDNTKVTESRRYMTWLIQPAQSSPFDAASCVL
jgi:hypothetical protein